MKDAGHSWRIFEVAKRKKYKPREGDSGMLGVGRGDKEDERARGVKRRKEDIVGKWERDRRVE